MTYNKFFLVKKMYVFTFIYWLIASANVCGAETRLHNFKETPLGYFDNKKDICGGTYFHTLNESLGDPIELTVSTAKDQGPLGTCVSYAVGTCYECLVPSFKVSIPEFTILAETHLSEDDGGDCFGGLFLGASLKIATRMGFVRKSRLTDEAYLKFVAQSNGINITKAGWKAELEEFIKRNEEEDKDIPICYRQHHSPIDNYNTTMANMGNTLRLYGKPEIDITSHRLSCVSTIHHITPEDLTRYLEKNRYKLPRGTVGLPGGTNINAIRHALNEGYPVAVALGVTSRYQYTPDYFDRENKLQYFKKTLLTNSWDEGKSVIGLPNGCYRDSSQDETVTFDDGEDRVFGPSYLTLLKKNLYELSGSHAVVLRGFNDSKRCFSLINSWSTGWGYDGLADISYDYIKLLATEVFAVAK